MYGMVKVIMGEHGITKPRFTHRVYSDLIFIPTTAQPTATVIPVDYNDQVTHYPQPQLRRSLKGE